jgi:WD40 repeat protein
MPIVNSIRAMAALIALAAPSAAFAQAGLVRSDTGAAVGAIQGEIREAVRTQLQISNSAGAITGLALSADGSTLAIMPSDHSIRVWDLPNGLQQARYDAANGLTPAGLAAIGFTGDAQLATMGNAGTRLTVVDPQSGRVVLDVPVAPGSARFFVIDRAYKRVITGGNDGIVRIRNLDTGELLVQIISTLTGWTAVDAQGRFDGTISGVDDVKWLASQLKLPIDNFSQPYYEPGLVARYVRAPSGFVAAAPTPVLGGIALPPKVSVLAQAGPGNADVTIVAQDQGGGVAAISLFQNGKLVPSSRQTGERKEMQNGIATTVRTYRVPLAPGANHFEAVAASLTQVEGEHATTDVSAGVVAAPAPAAPGPAPAAAPPPAAGLPTLHILTVGINKYKDARLNLDYGVSDATAILQSLQASQGVFGKVVAKKLTDQAATHAAIVKALADYQNAPPNDVLVVYLAGHGEIVGDDWYFLPHDFVFTPEGIKSTGISATTWRDALSRVGPQRVLILIDSCKSGGSIDTLATAIDRKLLRSLGRDAGVAILAGARRDQSAEEFPQLHHGAFTYVLLQGVSGKADAQHTGQITTNQLLTYSTAELPLLTKKLINQMQVPVAYSRGEDFLVHHSN